MDRSTEQMNVLLATPVSAVYHQATAVDVDTFVSNFTNNLNWQSQRTVVVIDNENNIFGVITRQDIVSMGKRQLNPRSTRAWEICSHHVVITSPDSSLSDAVAIMEKNNIHHLVVCDNGKLVGVISSLDIATFLSQSH